MKRKWYDVEVDRRLVNIISRTLFKDCLHSQRMTEYVLRVYQTTLKEQYPGDMYSIDTYSVEHMLEALSSEQTSSMLSAENIAHKLVLAAAIWDGRDELPYPPAGFENLYGNPKCRGIMNIVLKCSGLMDHHKDMFGYLNYNDPKSDEFQFYTYLMMGEDVLKKILKGYKITCVNTLSMCPATFEVVFYEDGERKVG